MLQSEKPIVRVRFVMTLDHANDPALKYADYTIIIDQTAKSYIQAAELVDRMTKRYPVGFETPFGVVIRTDNTITWGM